MSLLAMLRGPEAIELLEPPAIDERRRGTRAGGVGTTTPPHHTQIKRKTRTTMSTTLSPPQETTVRPTVKTVVVTKQTSTEVSWWARVRAFLARVPDYQDVSTPAQREALLRLQLR